MRMPRVNLNIPTSRRYSDVTYQRLPGAPPIEQTIGLPPETVAPDPPPEPTPVKAIGTDEDEHVLTDDDGITALELA